MKVPPIVMPSGGVTRVGVPDEIGRIRSTKRQLNRNKEEGELS